MIIIPAINLKNGYCVKLSPGQLHDAEVIRRPIGEIAKNWEELGASFLHLVDVDGAIVGHTSNSEAIKKVLNSTSVPVEVGGGVRSIQSIENLLNIGAFRVVIGTKAVGNPGFVRDAISNFGADRIAISIDAKNGMVAVEGWGKISSYKALDLAVEMRDLGIKSIIYTDISAAYGTRQPVNMDYVRELLKVNGLKIIVNGDIISMKDLEQLNETGVYGVIADRVLYDKKVELSDAIKMFK